MFFCIPCVILVSTRLSFATFTLSSNCRSITFVSCRVSDGDIGTVVTRGGTILGDWPLINWKPKKPVGKLMVFMRWNQICGRVQTQPLWFHKTWYWMAWFTILLICSLMPSVCGWYTVNIFSLTPASFMRAFQNFETKSLLQSLKITSSNPCSQYHSLSVKSLALSVVLHGRNQ